VEYAIFKKNKQLQIPRPLQQQQQQQIQDYKITRILKYKSGTSYYSSATAKLVLGDLMGLS
jgi:hypothetical protein